MIGGKSNNLFEKMRSLHNKDVDPPQDSFEKKKKKQNNGLCFVAL